MGFDAAIVWAFVGGLLLDVMLPERPIGSTTLAMLIAVGVALVVARVVESPRLSLIGVTAFVVSDTILGLEAFVLKRRWMPLAVMVTYHTALIGLALSLR